MKIATELLIELECFSGGKTKCVVSLVAISEFFKRDSVIIHQTKCFFGLNFVLFFIFFCGWVVDSGLIL